MKAPFGLGAVVLGFSLVALSLVWGLVFPAEDNWTPERAKEMSALSDEVHTLMFKAAQAKERPNMVQGGNPAAIIADYKDKSDRLDALKLELENIKDSPQTSAKYMRWAGITLVLVGAVLSMMAKGQ